MPPSLLFVVAGLSRCLRPDLVGKARGFSSVVRALFTPARVHPESPRFWRGEGSAFGGLAL